MELSEVRDSPARTKTCPQSRQAPHEAAEDFLFGESDEEEGRPVSFQVSHDGGDQTAFGGERPKTGMFAFVEKKQKKNSLVVSNAGLQDPRLVI